MSSQPATPSRPPVVVDWAPGVAPKPDPRTISKHVQRMVDVSASFFFFFFFKCSLYTSTQRDCYITVIFFILPHATIFVSPPPPLFVWLLFCGDGEVTALLVFHSLCLRTTITTRTASSRKWSLRKSLLAFRFPSALWTKRSECFTSDVLQRRGGEVVSVMTSSPPSIHLSIHLSIYPFREGLVSRDEITAYFMRASVICSKLGLGFVHNFQETTYMKPTFCDNCSGFVSLKTAQASI